MEKRCGPDRGPVAGHFHRAEGDLATTRARPSARSPRSTTTCACSTPAPAPSARTRPPLEAQTGPRWSTSVLALPETQADDARPGGGQPQGRALDLFAELRASGLRRLRPTVEAPSRSTPCPNWPRRQKHTIDRRRPPQVTRRHAPAPGRIGRETCAAPCRTGRRHRPGDGPAPNASTCSRPSSPARCALRLAELEPRLFSFNNPMGALPEVRRPGRHPVLRPQSSSPDPACLAGGRRHRGWDRSNQFYFQIIGSLAVHYGFDVDTPWQELPENVRRSLLYGSGSQAINIRYLNEKGTRTSARTPSRASSQPRTPLPETTRRPCARTGRYISTRPARPAPAPACAPRRGGPRRRQDAAARSAACRSAGAQLLSIAWPRPAQQGEVAEKSSKEITARLSFLIDVGLDYLCLERARPKPCPAARRSASAWPHRSAPA